MTQDLPLEPTNSKSEETLPEQPPESFEREAVSSEALLQASAESQAAPSETPSSASAEPLEASLSELRAGSSEMLPQDSVESQAAVPAETPPLAEPVASPQEPAPQPNKTQSKTLKTLQQFWRETQPKLKVGTIKALKITIQVLQWTVERLEAEPRSPAAKASSTQAKPASEQPSRQLPLPFSIGESQEKPLSMWHRVRGWWSVVLPKVRVILPESINQKLSDRALSGAIASILVILLWTTSSVFSSKLAKQIATAPPAQTTPVQKPVPKTTPSPKSTSAPPTVAQPSPSKPVAEAPNPTPKPNASPSPKPAPSPPPLKLSPEQTLIARIQDQVAEVSNQYVSGLIQSVQANFRSSRLTVNVGDDWYSLEESQQNKLSDELLRRAQQLDFIKLEIADPDGTLLARSPVIGSEMVIVRRGARGKGQEAENHSISFLLLTPFL